MQNPKILSPKDGKPNHKPATKSKQPYLSVAAHSRQWGRGLLSQDFGLFKVEGHVGLGLGPSRYVRPAVHIEWFGFSLRLRTASLTKTASGVDGVSRLRWNFLDVLFLQNPFLQFQVTLVNRNLRT